MRSKNIVFCRNISDAPAPQNRPPIFKSYTVLRSSRNEYYPYAADINTHNSAHLLAQLVVLLYQDALFIRCPLGIL